MRKFSFSLPTRHVNPHLLSHCVENACHFLRWLFLSSLSGLVAGFISVLFNFGMSAAVSFRSSHLWVVLLLPFAGLLIAGLYQAFDRENNMNTDTVIACIQTETYVPLRMAFLIFVSSILTVFCGGSVGREGAAVQIGGSIGKKLGEWFHFSDKDKKIMLMSGISAAFAALFGTPMAAAILPMEMANVGVLYYPALVPCVWASTVASFLAKALHAPTEDFLLTETVPLTFSGALLALLLGVLCALVSILFCEALHVSHSLNKTWFPNPYLRIFAGGCLVIVLTILLRTTDYLGPGMHVIRRFLDGEVIPAAFLLKILFTAVTIGAGYKGGEIVPSFFTGAAFGALFASVLGANVPLCAAAGMAGVFCGVTNCPLTALMIALELFGFSHAPIFMIVVAVSYMMSGRYSLYRTQKILFQKTE